LSVVKDGVASTAIVINAGNILLIARGCFARCFEAADERSIVGTIFTANSLTKLFCVACDTPSAFNNGVDIGWVEAINVFDAGTKFKASSVRTVLPIFALGIQLANVVLHWSVQAFLKKRRDGRTVISCPAAGEVALRIEAKSMASTTIVIDTSSGSRAQGDGARGSHAFSDWLVLRTEVRTALNAALIVHTVDISHTKDRVVHIGRIQAIREVTAKAELLAQSAGTVLRIGTAVVI
jgi:hypothetical protein